MKVKKPAVKIPVVTKSESEESDENSEVADSSSDISSDDEDIQEPNDPGKANDEILNEMDEDNSETSSDDEAPEEISFKPTKGVALGVAKDNEKSVKPEIKQVEGEPKKLAYDKNDEAKTIFCGNIPNAPNINETRIKDLFSEFGPVKSVRFRNETGKLIFSKKIKKETRNFLAYVVFENLEDAKKSLQLNEYKLLDNHLRVNMANNKNEAFTNKGTIFVGNLPFDALESEIHQYFSQVGNIEYVRKIANKGIAYVCFHKGVNIATALKLNDKPFKGRNLRISRCESREKQDKKKLFKKDTQTGKIVKQRVKKPHKMNEEAFIRGRANNNPIIKKIKETQKAKFNKFTDAKQLSKKEIFRRGGKMDQNQRDETREKSKKKQKFFGAKVDGIDKVKNKKSKVSKSIKDQKVIAKKLKSAAARASGEKS